MTRALSPEAYGAYALALAVSSLVGMLSSSWVRNVTLRLYFDAVERGTTRGLFLGTASLQAALFVTLYGTVWALLTLFGVELVEPRVMLSAGVTVVAGDLAVHALMLLRAERRTAAFATGEIGAGAVRFVLTLAGLAAGIRSPELLFDATTVGYLAAAAFGVPVLWRRMSGPFRIDVRGTAEVVRHGPRSLPFSVADWMERFADRLVLEGILGTSVVGIYTVGYTIGERTVGVLVSAVFMMAWPDVLDAYRTGGTKGARPAVRQAHHLYAWFSTGPVAFLIVHGGDVLRWIAGPEYHAAAPLVGIVAASMWIGGFTTYLNRHLELTKRFGTLSGIVTIGAVVNLALNLWWIPLFGMLGAAWATMANRVLNLVLFWRIRDRELVSVPVAAYLGAALASVAAWGASAALPVEPAVRMAAFVIVYAPVALLALRRSGGR